MPPDPTDPRRQGEIARRRAAQITSRERTALGDAAGTRAPLAPAAAIGLIVVGVWLFVGKWVLAYPIGVHGKDILLEAGFAVVVLLLGLRFRLGGDDHRRPAGALALACGLLLALAGAFLPHASARAGVNEVVCGLLVMLLATMTLGSRSA